MNISLTLDQILGLPDEILRISGIHCEYNGELDKSIYAEYDIKELRFKILSMFKKFKMLKLEFNVPIESNVRLSVNYDLMEGSASKRKSSQIENVVLKNTDNLLWGTSFYKTILEISKILTRDESVYLVDAMFGNKSEDFIAEKLGIVRDTLQSRKRSCLVKLWIKLEPLYNESVE